MIGRSKYRTLSLMMHRIPLVAIILLISLILLIARRLSTIARSVIVDWLLASLRLNMLMLVYVISNLRISPHGVPSVIGFLTPRIRILTMCYCNSEKSLVIKNEDTLILLSLIVFTTPLFFFFVVSIRCFRSRRNVGVDSLKTAFAKFINRA